MSNRDEREGESPKKEEEFPAGAPTVTKEELLKHLREVARECAWHSKALLEIEAKEEGEQKEQAKREAMDKAFHLNLKQFADLVSLILNRTIAMYMFGYSVWISWGDEHWDKAAYFLVLSAIFHLTAKLESIHDNGARARFNNDEDALRIRRKI